jgi:hypothetical protein
MDFFKVRSELRRMRGGDLFKLVVSQRMSKCLIGGVACPLYLHYKEFSFCVSEILGQGCQVERLKKLEQVYHDEEKINFLLPFVQKMEKGPILPEKKLVEFKVYFRDNLTRSIVYLGKIIERRNRERANNLRDLLTKAISDYSGCVEDPSTIFLLSL